MILQDKQKEIEFFDDHASSQQYDVFSEESSRKLIQTCLEGTGLRPGMRIADLGCGSGVFTNILSSMGFAVTGLDLSPALIARAKKSFPQIEFQVGDVEDLPYPAESLDGVLLSGILHHLPDKTACARSVHRVLKKGGVFMAFDPNRRNPFMWLYRVKKSPFYSSKGVTDNEQPTSFPEVSGVFASEGFSVSAQYLSGLKYRYVAPSLVSWLLPAYNLLDSALFSPPFMKSFRAFLITKGVRL